jgi:decaprenylphospho-beta-D-ribofuranose 2-oxidase
MPADCQTRELTGWGRTAASSAQVTQPSDAAAVQTFTRSAPARGMIARGLGRSYGDAAQNAGGLVLHTGRLDRVLALDGRSGLVTVQSGLSLGRLARYLQPHGLFLPVWPGTRAVTVGGAVAADVHGKNHHRDGGMGRHVTSMTVATADGQLREVSPKPNQDPDLFWGTLGGMGLTGVVTEVTLQALRVPSPWMSVDVTRAPDLDALLAALADADRRRYSVAWVDCLAAGRHTGRGVVTSADHACVEEVRSARRGPAAVPDPDPPARVRAPRWAPPGLLNRRSVGAFNTAWYLAAPSHRQGWIQPPARFFNPLDKVADWNRLYGPRGLVQYQCVVPDTATVETLLARLRLARAPSFLLVLKRFGRANPGPLSFPRPGWTLALDLPAGLDGLPALLDRMDHDVATAQGRVYLAKDSRLRPELLATMYPELEAWCRLRERVDPHRRWQSDLGRRLSL